ncbi:hypothetical protein MLAC_14770 [Mycobacterium lacus]|uniref:Uncharacterized protein n=1 Tax=Mycobacterium lacus TaxID=169765 RepID=A0A7I7NIS5_9MYCO|nr:hypothetical protein MLAC_14770 [Mycobacterium lacus]
MAFGDPGSVKAGGNPSVAGGPASNLNLAFAHGGFSDASAGDPEPILRNGTIAGVLFGDNSHANAYDGNANIATVVAGTGCSAHAASGNLNAAGVSGLLPGINNLSATATGGSATTFEFSPPALDFSGSQRSGQAERARAIYAASASGVT